MKAARVRMPRLKAGSAKVFALLALFIAGSTFSIVTALVQPQTASAITDEQKTFCKTNFPKGTSILNDQKTGIKQEWVSNDCEGEGYCIREGIGASLSSGGCKEAPLEASSAIVDGVKKGYGDLAADQLCGSDEQCKATMRGYVSACMDEYMQNPPSTAPEFPLIDTNWLVSCMSRDGKLDRSQISKLQAKFGENREKIANDAKAAEEEASKNACEEDGGTWVEESSECGTKVTCASSIQGIGWLICPAMNFMAEASDKIYLFLASKFLSVDVNLVAGVRDSWAKFRDVANIAFVIALLIVIYAQVTSVGISNYGIKKMLPKIVISAILVNVSYDIARIAVDLSNILGYGVAKFFDNFTFIETASDKSSLDALGNGLTIAGAFGVALVGAVGIAMAVSVPVLLSALLALALIALVLLAREALIVLLIAIAPLAFVAYLLPNTEQWYKKWVKLFSTLLLLFPIIGLVFGASKLAAITLLNAGAAANTNGEADEITQILAIGVMTIPFFVVPGLLKGALNAAGSVGGKLSGIADKAGKRVGGKVKDTSMLGAMAKQRDRDKQLKRAQILGGRAGNPVTKAWYRGANRATGKYGSRISAQAASTAQKLKTEDVDNEVARMQAGFEGPHTELKEATKAYENALRSGDVVKARAAQKILLSKGNAGVGAIQKVVEDGAADADNEAVSYAKSDLASAGLKGKNAALNAWSYDPASRKFADVKDDSSTYSKLSDAEFSSQTQATMDHALNHGGLTKERAERILDNKDLHGSLDDDKFAVLYSAAGRTAPVVTGSPGAASGGGTGSSGGGSTAGGSPGTP